MMPFKENSGPHSSRASHWVNVSYSPCESAASLGFGRPQTHKLAMRCSQFWLAKNYRLMFGHDWRPDGVMRSIGELAELSAPFELLARGLSFPRLFNLVAHPSNDALDRSGVEAERTSEGVLAVRRMCDVLTGPAHHTTPASKNSKTPGIDDELANSMRDMKWLPPFQQSEWDSGSEWRLWTMRAFMTRMLSPGIRICFGGKNSLPPGVMPGIFQEALLAFCDRKPLYLIGGFGGATADFAAALRPSNQADLYGISNASNYSYWSASATNSISFDPARSKLIDALIKEFGLPTDNILGYLRDRGLDALGDANGLDAQQNEELFRCTDMETALALIHAGVQNLS